MSRSSVTPVASSGGFHGRVPMTMLAIVALVTSLSFVASAPPVAAATADPPLPTVAIHVSENTAALETMTATAPTPTGSGTTGQQWWITSWRYFVAYQSVEEALKADGTPYVEVSDADIAAGRLTTADGVPRYPIVISLAAEAVADSELAPMRSYVNAGGFLLVGSSSLTRTTTGASRGTFALAAEMGLHPKVSGLQDWTTSTSFTKTADSRLTADVPSGTLLWGGKRTADTIPWSDNSRTVWQVTADDAQVLATGGGGVELATKAYGKGRFIYDAELQPLLGDTGYSSSAFAYAIYRRAIEWAFESAGMPIVKLSPWPYPYDSAGVVRHDLEASTFPGQTILSSARYEQSVGMRGDYYFTTGTLRISPTNPDTRMTDAQKMTDIGNLRTAVSTYGATVGSHNGGLPNPAGYPAPINDANAHTMWHWGPDQALDLQPAGYSSGADYARQSLLISFQDIETWMGTAPYPGATGLKAVDNGRPGCGAAGTCPRLFVSPYHDAGREQSHQILDALGAQTVAEQKVGPFPIRDFSYAAPHSYFSTIGLGVDNWYIGSAVQENLDNYIGTTDMQAAVDWYVNLGGLVNLYGHSDLRAYVAYLSTRANLWKTNAIGVRDWYVKREPVKVVPSFTPGTTYSVAKATVSGATDPQTAVELVIPNWSGTSTMAVSVLLNGSAAPTGSWRATAHGVKILVGTGVSSVEVDYRPVQAWTQTDWSGGGGQTTWSDPTRYQLATNVDDSSAGALALAAAGGSTVFNDTFDRQSGDPAPLTPWTAVTGSWSVANGVLTGTGATGKVSGYGNLYYVPASPPANYTITARVQLSANALGGGVGGRLNAATGAHYAIWLYPPNGGAGNAGNIGLIKFASNWTGYTTPAVASQTVDANWHDLRIEFAGARIRAWYDGTLKIDYTDPSPLSGSGITVDTYPPGSINVDSVAMSTLAAYSSSGTLDSSAFDSGAGSTWQTVSWNASTPTGTNVQLRTRAAATSADLASATWSTWYAASGSSIANPSGRWLQYEARLTTSDTALTPTLLDVTASYATVKADTTPPVVSVPAAMAVEATGPEGAPVTFVATATDNVDGTLSPTCTPASGSTFALGATTVTCNATDAAGNTGAATFTVTVSDTTPPVFSAIPANITVPATSAAGAIVTWTDPTATDLVSGSRPVTCAPLSGSAFPAGATSTVTCSASDAAGNAAQPATFMVTVGAWGGNDQPPTITDPGPQTSAEGASVSLQIQASDPDADPLTYTAAGLPAGLSIGGTSGTISGTLGYATAGSYNASVTADDGRGGTASVTFAWTVTNVDRAPTCKALSLSVGNGATGSVAASCTDPDGDPITAYQVVAQGAKGTASVAGTQLQYAAGIAQKGTDTFTYSASDGTLASAPATVSVTIVNPAPAAPTGLVAVGSRTAVTLDWADNTETDLAGFVVSRSTSASGPWTSLTTTPVTASNFTDSTAPFGSTSFYQVAAVDLAGQISSPASANASRALITFRSASQAANRGATTLALGRPSGIQAGDVLVASLDLHFSTASAPAITPPTGWQLALTETASGGLVKATYWHVAAASEPTSYTWKFSAASAASGIVLAYTGVDPTTPIDASAGQANAKGTRITAPSVTASVAGSMLVALFGSSTSTTFTPPTGMAERGDVAVSSGTLKSSSEACDAVLAAAGATGTRTAVAAKSATAIGQLVVLRPAP
jgi:hypothetical protein